MNSETASAKFSLSEIVFAIVNLRDAKAFLTEKEYTRVYKMFERFSKMVRKKRLNQAEFVYAASYIMAHFDLIAPYYKICGNSKMCLLMSLQEKEKIEYRKKADLILQKGPAFCEEWFRLHSEFLERFYP